MISKDWVKYHTFTSIGLSFLLGLLVYLDGYPNLDEFVITLLLTASLYWFAVLYAYSAIKAYRDKLINRGVVKIARNIKYYWWRSTFSVPSFNHLFPRCGR